MHSLVEHVLIDFMGIAGEHENRRMVRAKYILTAARAKEIT